MDSFEAQSDFRAWRVTADTLPTMVFTARPDGALEFLNRRWIEFTGHEPAAALENAWAQLVHPDDLEHVSERWRCSIQTGSDLTVELRVRKADDSFVWVSANASPLRAGNGQIVRWYGTAVDIDARKRAEETLRVREAMLADSERKFRALAEAIPVICWTADASGWIDWYSRRWYDFTGQTPAEAAGWGWQAAHHPDDFLQVMREWPQSIATGKPFEMEFRLRRYDGIFHWFLTRVEPLRDESGAIVRWYGSNVDIDAQKQALERTKRVAATLQDVFLPKRLPQFSGLRLDAVYIPAEADALVGGDWYDAFELPDGRLIFSIGDVSGHGLEASIIVGRLRQAIVTLAFNVDSPAQVLTEVDRILKHQEPDTIVTALVGFVNPGRTELQYASAGHPPPLIAYAAGEPAQMLPYGETPLGVDGGAAYTTHTAPIHPNTVVAVYTDGMTEFARDLIGAEEKLRMAVALLVGNTGVARPALAVQEIVLNDVPTTDDAALLCLQFSPSPQKRPDSEPAELEKRWRFHSSHAYSAHTSRREIVNYLRGLALDPDQIFAAELVIGEILANTVEHAPGLVEIHVDWTGEKPIVSVRDTGPGLQNLGSGLPENVLAEDGRGLYLIGALAEEASVKPSQGYGTELRVVLPIRRRLPSAPTR